MKHSIQPIREDEQGTLRFEGNPIVRYLLDAGPFDLNGLTCTPGFDREDWEHFAQLIGYSLNGWGELSYVSDTTFEVAEAMALEAKPPDAVPFEHAHYMGNSAQEDRIRRIEERLEKLEGEPRVTVFTPTRQIITDGTSLGKTTLPGDEEGS